MDHVEHNPGIEGAHFSNDREGIEALVTAKKAVKAEIGKRIVGQEDVLELLLTSLFARGHGLFIGVPGLAKTLLIQSLSESLKLNFNRIQFTPDLMPSDITGTDVLDVNRETGERSFRFIHGPVFTNILLADEINRTPPKTQAALLQAMQEREVTASGTTHTLDSPFLVMATQNPVEQEGTYPLPEAQLDRFMFSIYVDYPSLDDEVSIVQRTTNANQAVLNPVLSPAEILAFQDLILRVPVTEHMIRYAVRLVQASRPNNAMSISEVEQYVGWGAGPRASQTLILGAKARAALQGRMTVSGEDIRALAPAVLQHRIVMNFKAEAERIRPREVVAALLEQIGEHEA